MKPFFYACWALTVLLPLRAFADGTMTANSYAAIGSASESSPFMLCVLPFTTGRALDAPVFASYTCMDPYPKTVGTPGDPAFGYNANYLASGTISRTFSALCYWPTVPPTPATSVPAFADLLFVTSMAQKLIYNVGATPPTISCTGISEKGVAIQICIATYSFGITQWGTPAGSCPNNPASNTCPDTTIPYQTDSIASCSCPQGYSWTGYVCADGNGGLPPPTCPTGQQFVSGSCQCPTGQQLLGSSCQSICGPGQQYVNGSCCTDGAPCGCGGTISCSAGGQCQNDKTVNGECCSGPNGCSSSCGGSCGQCGVTACDGSCDDSCAGSSGCGEYVNSCSSDLDCYGTNTCQGGCCLDGGGGGSGGSNGGGGGGECGGASCLDVSVCSGGCDGSCNCGNVEDPLMIDLTGKGFVFTDVAHGVQFDMRDDGKRVQTAWTATNAQVGFLVLDRNGNGTIDNNAELFSNFSPQPGQKGKRTGFIALAVYDQKAQGGNQDGVIDAKDQVFSKLRVWVDKNHDGISQPNELFTLQQLGIKSISVHYEPSKFTDHYGNLFVSRSKITWQNDPGGRWIYDVELRDK